MSFLRSGGSSRFQCGSSSARPWQLGDIFSKIDALMRELAVVCLTNIFRQANGLADALEKAGVERSVMFGCDCLSLLTKHMRFTENNSSILKYGSNQKNLEFPCDVIPTVDMAKLFATQGVKTTIITTPVNASFFHKTIQRSRESDIDFKILKFPNEEADLPEGCEDADLLPTSQVENKDIVSKFFKAKVMLQEPLEQLLQECKPDCLVY
ncbi:hypothetical protein CRYUN_Cryun04dG0057200 [Craigia yunnanensis]